MRRDSSERCLAARTAVVLVSVVTLAGVVLTTEARDRQGTAEVAGFRVRDVMIPTRDGVRLNTRIYRPANDSGALPILLRRTPYGIEGAGAVLESAYKELVNDGYIFVFQDIRGRYGSEGTFVMQRPVREGTNRSDVDEGTDAHDTIEWLLENVPGHNGRVGLLGVSYSGWTTIMAALEPHPALKAISPQASPADMWMGDDFYHNGAFRLSYAFEYAYLMEASRNERRFVFDRYDTYDWYLKLGPLANISSQHGGDALPTWRAFVSHPDYDHFWKQQTVLRRIRALSVPTLNVAGWWDQEDFYGPMQIYQALEKFDSANINYLVVGPWNHGGWNRSGSALGPMAFGSDTSAYFRQRVQAPFFAHFLRGEGQLDLPGALTFDAGAGSWQSWDRWPPTAAASTVALRFATDGKLTVAVPGRSAKKTGSAEPDTPGYDEFVSDPAHPVPYRSRPVEATFASGSRWSTWLVEDQRFVDDRPDVLSWESEPLSGDLTLAGAVEAKLHASTTGTDADWVVKLIDVYPEEESDANRGRAGFQLIVSSEVFRGRYRQGVDRPTRIPSGKIIEYTFSLHTQNYTFQKSHRLMIQVQSTWFPVIDRNPQQYVANIFEARHSDFRAATHRVYRSSRYPSQVELQVTPQSRSR